ncbi:hypothetical protein [Actinomadura madurae]|uniref:hypothetical protein n=1 Tax=Actinomadura madurae TaxID=1993 RepID=UPI0020D23511|nr:hypothetical protein [Actinomadura madurae]MCQ0021502.1 hypothetical protein [Actinomadura madurae]
MLRGDVSPYHRVRDHRDAGRVETRRGLLQRGGELYGVPPAEFVERRKRLAQEAKADGDAALAKRIGGCGGRRCRPGR